MTLIEFLRARYDDDERTYNYLNDMGEQGPYYFLLDDTAAKRRIIDLREAWAAAMNPAPSADLAVRFADQVHAADMILRLLALPYANHADYQQDWRP